MYKAAIKKNSKGSTIEEGLDVAVADMKEEANTIELHSILCDPILFNLPLSMSCEFFVFDVKRSVLIDQRLVSAY